MLKDVIIDIKSVHDDDTGGDIEFTTDGYYTYSDNIGCVSYLESEVTGMDGTRTSVFIMPEQIIVDHDGTVTSRMVFRKGEKSQFLYQTPYGKATMRIDTKSISHNFDENGGSAVIDYVIDLEHTVFSKNKFMISVKGTGDSTYAELNS